MTVRAPHEDERDAILGVVAAAFGAGGRDPHEELDIVTETWARGAAFEFVDVEDGLVVGHVLAAEGHLDGRPIVGVAPLAVLPALQGNGIGTALMWHLVEEADGAGLPALVLLGNPDFYGRFGFEPAQGYGISYAPVGDTPAFQIRPLAAFDPSLRGTFVYRWEDGDR